MSADNWTYCPKCKANIEDRRQQDRKKLEASYGKVSSTKYIESLQALVKSESEPIEETLREDYEIGVYGEEFSVNYKCRCTVCGFEFSYEYAEDVQ